MMTSRMAGKEPAHQIPSREDFLKLSEDQRNQINEAVSSDRSFSFPTGVPPHANNYGSSQCSTRIKTRG